MARNDKSVNTKVGMVRKIFWAFSAVFLLGFSCLIFSSMPRVQWPSLPDPTPAPIAKNEPKPEPEPEPPAIPPDGVLKWYQGGSLHKKSALDWQNADYDDKLATCADFVAHSWERKEFKPRIQQSIRTIDDMKPYALELVTAMDAATKKAETEEKNRQLFANETVAGMAVINMTLMGWYK